jgi:hypothetical protein
VEVAHAFLAVSAEITPDGKFHVLSGDIDTLRGHFPGILEQPLSLVVKILFSAEECNRDYQLRVELLNPDGRTLEALDRPIHPPLLGQANRRTKLTFMLRFLGIHFPAPGDYAIRLSVNNEVLKTLPLYVESVAPDGQPSQE